MRLPLGTALALVPLAAALAQQPTQAPLPALRLPTVQTPSGPQSLQPQSLAAPQMVPANPPLAATATPAAPAPAPQATPAPQAAPAPQAEPGQPGAPPTPVPPPPNVWLPKPVADLLALDKVTARTTLLTVRVGQTATFGSLSIAVRACNIRPPDQPADATAFLDITDSHLADAQFHGWMVMSVPSLSVLEHPIYDVRLAGCHD